MGKALQIHGRDHRFGGGDHIRQGCYEIKMAADDAEVDVAEFVFEIPPDLDGASLVFVRAYNTTAAASGLTTVEVDNLTTAAVMLSTAVTIEAGELSSKTAGAQPVIDTANNTVSEGDQIMVSVADAAGGLGTGVMLRFS